MAFGPGYIEGTALPGMPGNTAISGHRDTHFAMLKDLVVGDELWLETVSGRALYRVASTEIVDKGDTRALDQHGPDRLTLVTCYPFDAIVPGGPLRYVVMADKVPASSL
jgi:sortase A